MFDFDLSNYHLELVPPGTYVFEVLTVKTNNEFKTINMSFAVVGTEMIHEERFHLLNRFKNPNRNGISSVKNLLAVTLLNVVVTNITDSLLQQTVGKKFIGEIAHNEADDGQVYANLLFYKYEPYPTEPVPSSSDKPNIRTMKALLEDEGNEG